MEKAAGGRSQAFDALVGRRQHRLQRFANRMLGGDSGDAADVVAAAFVRLWEIRATFRQTGSVESWLLATVYRLCLDCLRNRSRCLTENLPQDEKGSPDASTVAGVVEAVALGEAVRQAIMELPESHRAVLILSVYEELSYEEIAAALEIPPGTVASRRSHAVAMLRRKLAAWEEGR